MIPLTSPVITSLAQAHVDYSIGYKTYFFLSEFLHVFVQCWLWFHFPVLREVLLLATLDKTITNKEVNFIHGDKQYILELSYPCDQNNIAGYQILFYFSDVDPHMVP